MCGDVLALARVHMAKDEDMDIEDAIDAGIEEILHKFKESSMIKTRRMMKKNQEASPGDRDRMGRRKKCLVLRRRSIPKNPGLKKMIKE